ncbi:hypothetical protein [uncultured Croceitalea sp.]|uniref:hypothetical protein n=1 Tax=uncultured Croceitalea sp. TaxID=1798908 RepID=UPI0033067B77
MDTKNKLRYGLAIVAGILLVLYFIRMDFQNFDWGDLLGPISMLLVIIAMILEIRNSKKSEA